MKKEYIIRIFWSLVLVFLTGTIVYLNITKLPYNIDTDFIAEINYSRAVWEYGSLFPEEWICANELMFFRPTIFAALLYGVTGKYILSYAAALCMTLVCILASAWYLLSAFTRNVSHKLMALCLLLSFCGCLRSFVVLTCLYYGYYGFYLAVMLLTMGALSRQLFQKRVHQIQSAILGAAAFLLGIASVRMTVMLYLPVGFIAVMYIWKKRETPVNKQFLVLSAILFLANAGGVAFGKLFVPDGMIYSDVMHVHISDFDHILDFLWSSLASAVRMLLGTSGGTELLSVETLDIGVKALLIMIVFVFLKKQDFRFKKDYITVFFLIYFMMVLMLLTFTTLGTGCYTYYFFLPVAVIYLILRCMEYKKANIFLTVISLVMIVTNYCVYYEPDFSSMSDENTAELVQWLEDHEIDICTAYFWTGGPIEAVSDGRIRVAYLKEGFQGDLQPALYLADKNNYDPAFTDCYIILTDGQEKSILENSMSRLHTWECEKSAEIGEYNVYRFSENPSAVYEMPESGDMVEHLPKEHFLGSNAILNEDGTVSSTGEEGFVIFGPYSRVKDGIYTIEMDYELLSERGIGENVGWIDIAKDGGSVAAETNIIPEQKNGTAILEHVKLSAADNVEMRMYVHEGYTMKVKKIRITKTA